MGLEEQLAEVTSESELWEVVNERITEPSPRWMVHFRRFVDDEASAFMQAGARLGLDPEKLVLEYWARANKDSLTESFPLAKQAMERDYGYGYHLGEFRRALDEHLGWMRAAGISLPSAIVNELTPHARLLFEHVSSDPSFHYDYMPIVNMFESVMPDLSELRVSTSKGVIRHYSDGMMGLYGDEDYRQLAEALNIMEPIEPLEGYPYWILLVRISGMFTSPAQGTRLFFTQWDWSSRTDDVYGRFILSMSNPDMAYKQFSTRRTRSLDAFLEGYSMLSGKIPPSPGISGVLALQLEQIIALNDEDANANELLPSLRKDGEASAARGFMETLLMRELHHEGLDRAPIKPNHLAEILKLFEKTGGDVRNGEFEKLLTDYIRSGLRDRDLDELCSMATQFGMGPGQKPQLYRNALESMCQLAASSIENSHRWGYDRYSRDNDRQYLAQYAERICALAAHLENPEMVHKQLRQTAESMFKARYGYGLHYFSSLIVEYNNNFHSSPRDVVLQAVSSERLQEFFINEKNLARRGRNAGTVLDLYDDAHALLFGIPVPRQQKEREDESSSSWSRRSRFDPYGILEPRRERVETPPQQPQPPKIWSVTLYIGSKKVDGTNQEIVEQIRSDLESKIGSLPNLEQGEVPGKGRLYGFKMAADYFIDAARKGVLPPAIQAIYVKGGLPKLDEHNFRITQEGEGGYIQTAPVPNTLSIFHVNEIVKALSGEAPPERKTAPHDISAARYARIQQERYTRKPAGN